mmetsp:Transcript_65358/g.156260  ORF Transcript_65358/g.156260 Transcript_65358/m.156260 type:complete len:285 (+) Transcript_65358:168-1022(+)
MAKGSSSGDCSSAESAASAGCLSAPKGFSPDSSCNILWYPRRSFNCTALADLSSSSFALVSSRAPLTSMMMSPARTAVGGLLAFQVATAPSSATLWTNNECGSSLYGPMLRPSFSSSAFVNATTNSGLSSGFMPAAIQQSSGVSSASFRTRMSTGARSNNQVAIRAPAPFAAEHRMWSGVSPVLVCAFTSMSKSKRSCKRDSMLPRESPAGAGPMLAAKHAIPCAIHRPRSKSIQTSPFKCCTKVCSPSLLLDSMALANVPWKSSAKSSNFLPQTWLWTSQLFF